MGKKKIFFITDTLMSFVNQDIEILKNHFDVCGSVILFIIFFLLSFQGFDITDSGYHFTNQYQLLKYPLSSIHFNPMFILSDFAGGIWLHLIGIPNVFWGRLGGAILLSICAFVVASILEAYFPKKDVFIAVLISVLFLTSFFSQYIHYFTFPALLTLVFLWVFQKCLSVPFESRAFAAYAFILGLLFVPIVLSRFTLVVLVVVVPLIALYFWLTRRPLDGLIRGVMYALLGVILATGVVLYVFSNLEILGLCINSIKTQLVHSATGGESISASHTMTALLTSYTSQYLHVILGVLLFTGGVLFIGRIKDKLSLKLKWISFIFILMAIAAITLNVFFPQMAHLSFFLSYGIPRLFIGVIILCTLLFLYYHNTPDNNLAILLLVACTFMVFNPLGSNTGIIKSTHAFWLVLPLSLLCTQRLGTYVDTRFIKTLSSLIPTILVIMLIFAVFFHATNVYRDDPNRLNLTTPFESPQLKWTYSTPERVQVTDELIDVIKRETNPDDYVLMVNGMPMLYYLTETRPALGQPWLFTYSLDHIIALEKERVEKGEIEPKLFIYSKVNTLNRYWPQSDIPLYERYDKNLNYLRGQYIDTYDYSLLWENEAFAVYRQSVAWSLME